MSAAQIFIAGLPGAGKTTFLAALWYLIRSGEIPTELSYAGLHGIDVKYLNDIQQKWLDAEPMGRTRVSNEQIAEINLKSPAGDELTMYLPDFAGEGFRRMWEDRRARQSIASTARSSG